ncbi:hypothetical protein, partial [Shewanella baltica]|uniref:hypothetical protein n=1 Tax=Shewanella baltica TaxID=62322 RepID=UPI00217D19C8
MIINQTIKNGFTVVNKTGAYFSLISAGGVVNVSLSEKGRTVLDTKMWVGMSIDKAIPFDEITIKGDDGAVEFWAGDVSMSQARFSMSGASAIRSSVKFIFDNELIVGADLVRTAIRVRSDKEVFIGGAGLKNGWRVAPNETVEIPLSGVLYAKKQTVYLDYSAPEVSDLDEVFTGQAAGLIGRSYESEDGLLRLAETGSEPNKLYRSQDGGASWNIIDTNIKRYFYDARLQKHFVYKIAGTGVPRIITLKTSSDGFVWRTIFRGALVPDANIASDQPPAIVGKTFQALAKGELSGVFTIAIDIETGESLAKVINLDNANHKAGFWLDDRLMKGVFSDVNNDLYKTDDGGNTWRLVRESIPNSLTLYTLKVASNGKNLLMTGHYPLLSHDGGDTWVQAGV